MTVLLEYFVFDSVIVLWRSCIKFCLYFEDVEGVLGIN